MNDLKKSTNEDKFSIKEINDGSVFLEKRIIFMEEEFDEYTCNELKKQLLYLYQTKDNKKDITLYINSDGGIVTGFLMLYDLIKSAPCKINTICIGNACSAGAFLLMSGDNRKAYKNSEIMVHGLSGGVKYNKLHTMEQYVEGSRKLQDKLDNVLLKHTKITKKDLSRFMKEDNFLTAEEALKLGIIDEVIQ